MSTEDCGYFSADPIVSESDKNAVLEYEQLKLLESTGLLSVNFSSNQSPTLSIIAHLPCFTIDRYGCRNKRDNVFFRIRYPRFAVGFRPILDWPSDSDLPDSQAFRGIPEVHELLTRRRYPSRLFNDLFRGRGAMREPYAQRTHDPSALRLALDICGALDMEVTLRKVEEAKRRILPDPPSIPASRSVEPEVVETPQPPRQPQGTFIIRTRPTVGEAPIERSRAAPALTGKRIDTLRDAAGKPVYIDQAALATIHQHIDWSESTEENRVEQGGLLIGEKIHDGDGTTALVTQALPARGTSGSSAYVKFDHLVWKRMLDEYDTLVEAGKISHGQTIIGWYHTHPNMSVFMSGTDMGTQRSLFGREENVALVLNPQARLCGCFRGSRATPTPLTRTPTPSSNATSSRRRHA